MTFCQICILQSFKCTLLCVCMGEVIAPTDTKPIHVLAYFTEKVLCAYFIVLKKKYIFRFVLPIKNQIIKCQQQ